MSLESNANNRQRRCTLIMDIALVFLDHPIHPGGWNQFSELGHYRRHDIPGNVCFVNLTLWLAVKCLSTGVSLQWPVLIRRQHIGFLAFRKLVSLRIG